MNHIKGIKITYIIRFLTYHGVKVFKSTLGLIIQLRTENNDSSFCKTKCLIGVMYDMRGSWISNKLEILAGIIET